MFGEGREGSVGFEDMRGRKIQIGSGGYVFCGSCNSGTGGWYGRAYVDWAFQGMRMAEFSRAAPSLYFPFFIFPLRVLKQILCIFFATSDEGMRLRYEDIVRFVLNKQETGMNPAVRIYAYFNQTGRVRQTGRVVRATFGAPMDYDVISEFSFRPWGYVLSESRDPPDPRLVDITWFSRFTYSEEVMIWLRVPILNVETPFPGDYRNAGEVRADAIRSMVGASDWNAQ